MIGNKDIDTGTDVGAEHKQTPIEKDNNMVTAPQAQLDQDLNDHSLLNSLKKRYQDI